MPARTKPPRKSTKPAKPPLPAAPRPWVLGNNEHNSYPHFRDANGNVVMIYGELNAELILKAVNAYEQE